MKIEFRMSDIVLGYKQALIFTLNSDNIEQTGTITNRSYDDDMHLKYKNTFFKG